MPATQIHANGVDWRQWMRAVGEQVLRAREFLGLSQDQLAALAGVSQGAISRLENGRGISTPLVVVSKIGSALRAGLSQVDQSLLSPEARRIVELGMHLPDPSVDAPGSASPARDPGAEELLRTFHRLSDRQRRQFLHVMRAMVSAFGSDDDAASIPADAPPDAASRR